MRERARVLVLGIPPAEGREAGQTERTGRLADVEWWGLALKDTGRSVVDICGATSWCSAAAGETPPGRARRRRRRS